MRAGIRVCLQRRKALKASREASPIAKETASRMRRAREAAAGSGLDGLLVTHLPDVRYLCGFSGSSGMLLLLNKYAYFITDFRYREQARVEVSGARVVIQNDGHAEALRKILASHVGKRAREAAGPGVSGGGAQESDARGRGRQRERGEDVAGGGPEKLLLGFDPEHISYAEVTALRRRLRETARLSPLKSSLALLRAPKSPRELGIMGEGIRIAERALKEVLRAAGAATTEARLAAELEAEARRLGAESPSFETIVASGKRGALVHARPSRKRLAGVAVIDWGIVHEGYCTDCTRTLAFGRVPSALRRAHGLVLDAQERALEAVGPGVRAREVDRAAREVIEAAGLGHAFGHGLGHGVGLEVHERPHVSARSDDVLEEGMVFTIEPGIYLPGLGGVRVEDMAVVTRDGAELLTSLPRTLDPADYL